LARRDLSGSTKIIRQNQYDFLGRPFRVSNPTRSAAGTDFTETRFDGAGRMVKTIAPDLSETIYTPLGSEPTITAPAIRKTKRKKYAVGSFTSFWSRTTSAPLPSEPVN
jgi:hypothetical protein